MLTNSTVSGNTARDKGGGIYSQTRNIKLFSSTIAANVAEQATGGGIYVKYNSFNATELEIVDSIIASNTADSAPDLLIVPPDDDPNLPLVVNYTLIGDTTGTEITPETGIGNHLNVDARLAPLADNGGPTQTHALLSGSPALNAGDPNILFEPTEYDQRGADFSRVAMGRIDIGAYEAQTIPSADFDANDEINGHDFLTWQRGYGVANAVRTDGNSDDDTDVDASDLAAWSVTFGRVVDPGPGDLDADGGVDGEDFLRWQRGYGAIYNASQLEDWQSGFGDGGIVGEVVSGQSAGGSEALVGAAMAVSVGADGGAEVALIEEAAIVALAERGVQLPTAIESELFEPLDPTTVDDSEERDEIGWLSDELLEAVFG